MTTGRARFPWNRRSEIQPARRLPTTPKASEMPMICVALSSEKVFCFWRNSTPQSLTACWVM